VPSQGKIGRTYAVGGFVVYYLCKGIHWKNFTIAIDGIRLALAQVSGIELSGGDPVV
jgi:hypothetical protein